MMKRVKNGPRYDARPCDVSEGFKPKNPMDVGEVIIWEDDSPGFDSLSNASAHAKYLTESFKGCVYEARKDEFGCYVIRVA